MNSIEQIDHFNYLVVSGSLPIGLPGDILNRLGVIAKKRNAKLIVDTTGPALKDVVDANIYLIKPNLKELNTLMGNEGIDFDNVGMTARKLIERGKCEVIVVSMGAEGALLVTKDMLVPIKPPLVNRKSTIGAGDSMVAGIVLSISNNLSLLEAVQYGVACGTAATKNEGSALCKLEDVITLFESIKDNT